MALRLLAFLVFTAALRIPLSLAGDGALFSTDESIQNAIDHYIQLALDGDSVPAVGRAPDEALLRRTMLDLAGRIPTQAEQTWYESLPAERRQEKLVDRLMRLPDASFHTANELDSMLLPNKPYDDEFRRYVLWATQQNRSWDQMFRDMLEAKATEGPLKGATPFLRSRVRQVDDMTNDTAILFFGVNVSCAKCHDHPLVEDWKQDHFYGMQSFFTRTYQTKKNAVAEKFFDEVKFKTTGGEEKVAAYMFLTGDVVSNGTPAFSDDERKTLEEKVRNAEQKDDSEVPVPAFSPRKRLVELALLDQNDTFFSKNIANRIWARMMGVGLVNPLDQMHSGNPPSHPELLDWLARDIKQNGYYLPRLIRGITLSETYARSSEWTSADERPPSHYFAVAQSRPLTPHQLATSLRIAVRNPENWPAVDADDEWKRERDSLENQANGWAREFEQPSENFQVAVDEALFFNNNSRVQDDLLRDSGDSLIGYLKTLDNNEQVVTRLWQIVLNRSPVAEEIHAATEWLQRSEDNRLENIRQLAWTLLAGPEFRFNH